MSEISDLPRIDYVYKPVRRLTLRIRQDGRVVVTVPDGLSDEVVAAFVEANRQWLAGKLAELKARLPEGVEQPLTPQARQALLERARALVTRHSVRMGVRVNEVRVRAMRTRWGSCNIRARRIWLSTRLAAYPSYCLEAVIVHELAHLIESGHTPRFYRLMDQYFPMWRQAEHTLNGRLPRAAQ